MAELVDALVSGASGFAIVQVRVLFWALPKIEKMQSYTEDDDWHVSLFAREIADAQYKKEEKYECLNGTGWIYCIPFEGNEHLL